MDINEIWSASLSYIQNEINSVVGYNTYIKDIVPISFEGEDLTVAVSTSICKTMIELRYTDIIEKLSGIDLDSARRVAGNGFYYLLGDVARLHSAVLRYRAVRRYGLHDHGSARSL